MMDSDDMRHIIVHKIERDPVSGPGTYRVYEEPDKYTVQRIDSYKAQSLMRSLDEAREAGRVVNWFVDPDSRVFTDVKPGPIGCFPPVGEMPWYRDRMPAEESPTPVERPTSMLPTPTVFGLDAVPLPERMIPIGFYCIVIAADPETGTEQMYTRTNGMSRSSVVGHLNAMALLETRGLADEWSPIDKDGNPL